MNTILYPPINPLYENAQKSLTLFIFSIETVKKMRNVFLLLLSYALFSSCFNYHKLDFHASNQGFAYLDSLGINGKRVVLPYPSDAFKVAKPFFRKMYGARDYRNSKPYDVKLVNDSTWEVWTNRNFYRELSKKSTGVGGAGVGISIYDGNIIYYKENR